jgi:hypothetical protein
MALPTAASFMEFTLNPIKDDAIISYQNVYEAAI